MNTEQERAELLPCPFCGEGKDLIVQHHEGTVIHPAYRIYCDNCGGSNGYTDRGDHVENWNRRAAIEADRKRRGEPVAWMAEHQSGEWHVRATPTIPSTGIYTGRIKPLYEAPQPAEPVKLPSDNELLELSAGLIDTATSSEVIDFARALLARYGKNKGAAHE